MDCAHHPGPGQRDSAIRGVTTGNRRNFPEDAHANAPQPGARRLGPAQSSSGRPAQSRILTHSPWTHADRSSARALPMVGETSARTASEPKSRAHARATTLRRRADAEGPRSQPVTAVPFRSRMSRIFLLSPAYAGGQRARMIMSERAQFDLARRLRSENRPTLGEVFTFLSGLYFRGKLAYANVFAQPAPRMSGVLVITPNRGPGPGRVADWNRRPARIRHGGHR